MPGSLFSFRPTAWLAAALTTYVCCLSAGSGCSTPGQRVPAVSQQQALLLDTNTTSAAAAPVPLLPPTEIVQQASFETEQTDGVGLDDLVSLAMQHNPAIQQAAAMASQASGIQRQVGLKPNPSIGYFGEEIGNDSAAGLHGAFLSQTFVRGGKLGLNRAVAGQDVQRVRWLAEAQRYRVRNDVQALFYEALAAQKRLALAREFRVEAKEGLEISKARVLAQEAARPDVLQSEVQLGEVDLSIQRAEFEFTAAWQRITALAGVPELAPSFLLGDFEIPAADRDIETVYAYIADNSPLLAAACAQVHRAKANLSRQRVQAIPNVTAQVGTGYDDATGDEFANVQLSMPLPVHNQNQGNIQAAYAEYCAATQNAQRIRMQIRSDLALAVQSFRVAQATVAQYESIILPKASETLALMQEARLAGEFDFLRVFTARRTYFDANLKYVTAQAELCKASTRIDGMLLTGALNNIVGSPATDDLRGSALSGQ